MVNIYFLRARRIGKTLGLTLLSLVLLVSLYLLAALLLSRIGVRQEANARSDVSIFILTNGVHTDLVMPIRNEQIDWSRQIRFQHTTGGDSLVQYVALGWGDKGFYLNTPTWADLTFSTGFKAAFALSTTAMHTTFYKNVQEGENCVKINLSKENYARLIEFVRESFAPDAQGNFVKIDTKANYGTNDAFYEANGRYSLFYTCNTWTNDALKTCGQKACWWTPFDTGIFYQYR